MSSPIFIQYSALSNSSEMNIPIEAGVADKSVKTWWSWGGEGCEGRICFKEICFKQKYNQPDRSLSQECTTVHMK